MRRVDIIMRKLAHLAPDGLRPFHSMCFLSMTWLTHPIPSRFLLVCPLLFIPPAGMLSSPESATSCSLTRGMAGPWTCSPSTRQLLSR